jgi:hypothetical protein
MLWWRRVIANKQDKLQTSKTSKIQRDKTSDQNTNSYMYQATFSNSGFLANIFEIR